MPRPAELRNVAHSQVCAFTWGTHNFTLHHATTELARRKHVSPLAVKEHDHCTACGMQGAATAWPPQRCSTSIRDVQADLYKALKPT